MENYNSYRRKAKKIKVGSIFIGGDSPVSVQSMTNVSSADFDALYLQMKNLEDVGCDIIRMTVNNDDAVKSLAKLKNTDIKMPIVADIHFSSRLATEAAAAGADKIRINPGNIGSDEKVRDVVNACRGRNIPIRIGVNSGSLEKEILAKYGHPCAEALAESALYHASLLEKYDYTDIILSVKSSDVRTMIETNRILAAKCDYPIHLGVTEAGTAKYGVAKSFAGIGSLLSDGIGDTMRVSLTDDPVREVLEGRRLLHALNIDENRVNIVSCPTCGRTKYDMIPIVNEIEDRIAEMHPTRKITLAVMGCAVNGPGEAREADIGVAGGENEGLLFVKGEIIRKIPQDEIVQTLIYEVNRL